MELQQVYPDIHIHTISGDSLDLMDNLDKGLYDFAVLWDPVDLSNYESIQLPHRDRISILMPANCELAQKEQISMKDLVGLPIITSRQQLKNTALDSFLRQQGESLNIVATYNLIYNASLMVQEGMGYAIGFDQIIDTSTNRNLICKPLYPVTELSMNLVWKKYQVFTKAAHLYLQKVTEIIQKMEE